MLYERLLFLKLNRFYYFFLNIAMRTSNFLFLIANLNTENPPSPTPQPRR